MSKPKNSVKNRRLCTAAECGEELGLSTELVRDYAMRGCPHDKAGAGKPNRFDPDEVAAWMKASNLTGQPGRPAEGDSPDIEVAKLREINLRCRKHELDVAEREGQLVPIEDVKRWINEHVGAARNKFLGFGARITPALEGRDNGERQAIVDEGVREILGDLADDELARA